MSILYAEDDVSVREVTTKILSIFFKTVQTVDNGADAIKIYEQMRPDIVMLDIQIPFINGLEVASMIREKDHITPIIINTGYQENQNLLKAVKLNLADYLIKPFSFEELRLSLLEAIKRLELNGLIYSKISENLYYDFMKKIIILKGESITLTKNEVLIFEQLVTNKGSLVTYQKLEETLGLEFHESKASIKNTILRLRKKIGKETIHNIQDFGYLLA